MTWVRPEVADLLARFREVIAAAGVVALGIWVALPGGYLLVPVGAALMALGFGWAVLAWRRMRFERGLSGAGQEAPGIVEIDEGQIGYLGPGAGGFVGLADLVELRLLTLRGRRVWRLKQSDGQALLIPVDAAGAEALFDGFVALPGMDAATLIAALHPGPGPGGGVIALATQSRLIWARPGRGIIGS